MNFIDLFMLLAGIHGDPVVGAQDRCPHIRVLIGDPIACEDRTRALLAQSKLGAVDVYFEGRGGKSARFRMPAPQD